MKKYFPIITLAAAAYGVIYWLRKKAAAGKNLRYEIADIAIDIPKILESNFARIYFNTKLRLINDESVSVNVKQVNLNANIGNRTLGKILSNTPFEVSAKSSQIVRIQTSFSSGEIVLYLIELIKTGFAFDDPISVDGYILTDLGKINVNYTKNPSGGMTGTNRDQDLIKWKIVLLKLQSHLKMEKDSLTKTLLRNDIYRIKNVIKELKSTGISAPDNILNNIQGNC